MASATIEKADVSPTAVIVPTGKRCVAEFDLSNVDGEVTCGRFQISQLGLCVEAVVAGDKLRVEFEPWQAISGPNGWPFVLMAAVDGKSSMLAKGQFYSN